MSTVDHPKHYNVHPAGVECIDVVEHMTFNLGNAVKYIWRADHKDNSLEDLRKAAWYVEREIERLTKPTPRVESLRSADGPIPEQVEAASAPEWWEVRLDEANAKVAEFEAVWPSGTYATIKVRDGESREWPVVERVIGGWQSGAHHYPDSSVESVRVLEVRGQQPGVPVDRSTIRSALREMWWGDTVNMPAEEAVDLATDVIMRALLPQEPTS